MSQFRVELTLRAEMLVLEAAVWWLEHREKAADLFDHEFAEAVDKLKSSPAVFGTRVRNQPVEVRRMLMPKTRTHVYYTTDLTSSSVTIVCVWGAVKGAGPDLRQFVEP